MQIAPGIVHLPYKRAVSYLYRSPPGIVHLSYEILCKKSFVIQILPGILFLFVCCCEVFKSRLIQIPPDVLYLPLRDVVQELCHTDATRRPTLAAIGFCA